MSVNSLLQRARKSIEASREAAPPEVTSSDSDLLQRFIHTWESGDVAAFTALLADDARFSMPPQPEWFTGSDAIGQFFGAIWLAQPGPRRLLTLRANGGPALALYRQTTPNAPDAPYEPSGISLVTLRAARIAEITLFRSPKLFPLFGLPANLPSG